MKFSRSEEDYSETSLLRDVAFNRHSMQDGNHVSPYDNDMVQIGADGIEVKLVQGIDVESFKRVLSMATRATTGLDLTKGIPGEWVDCDDSCDHDFTAPGYNVNHAGITVRWIASGRQHQVPFDKDWEEMLRGGLQSAVETQTVVFAVSGVSRACTHQIVRSRKAGFHQQSQRATFYGENPEIRMPESVWRNERARAAFQRAVLWAQDAYRIACEEDVSYQDARYILPEGTTNYILCEYTVREFLNVYAYRACSMFNWEIVSVMRRMGDLLKEQYPWLADYIKISCEKSGPARDMPQLGRNGPTGEPAAHTCTFQGWESVEGQCDFPWARETNRQFRSDHHRIERAAARKLLPIMPVAKVVEPETLDAWVQDRREQSVGAPVRPHLPIDSVQEAKRKQSIGAQVHWIMPGSDGLLCHRLAVEHRTLPVHKSTYTAEVTCPECIEFIGDMRRAGRLPASGSEDR